MKRYVFNITTIMLVAAASAFFALSCGVESDPGTPIFADTELMDASYNTGVFSYSPGDDVEYIVLGLFTTNITTVGKTITNMNVMTHGSRTGLLTFTRSSVNRNQLYNYVDASKNFTIQNDPGAGAKCWAVWGYNSDWVIISSSKETCQGL